MEESQSTGGAMKRAGEGDGKAHAQRPRLAAPVPPEVQRAEGAADPR